MKPLLVSVVTLALVGSACSGDGGSVFPDAAESGGSTSLTGDIDVCSLLTDAELTATLGRAPVGRPSEPAGPFTGCSWGTGFLIVQIAESDSMILAPGEDECPSVGVGDESVSCNGGVKFRTNGIFTSVRTIERVSEAELTEIARILEPKLQG